MQGIFHVGDLYLSSQQRGNRWLEQRTQDHLKAASLLNICLWSTRYSLIFFQRFSTPSTSIPKMGDEVPPLHSLRSPLSSTPTIQSLCLPPKQQKKSILTRGAFISQGSHLSKERLQHKNVTQPASHRVLQKQEMKRTGWWVEEWGTCQGILHGLHFSRDLEEQKSLLIPLLLVQGPPSSCHQQVPNLQPNLHS